MDVESILGQVSVFRIIAAAFTGALLEMESYFVGMLLISQPIIAGGLAGLILGDVLTGVVIGSIVQLIWLNPPVGAYVPPSSSGVAFIATSGAVLIGGVFPDMPRDSILMYGIAGGAAVGYFIGQMDIWNRKFNTRIMHRFEGKILEGKGGYINVIQVLACLAKMARDFILYLAVFFIGLPLAANVYETLPAQFIQGFVVALWFMPALGFASLFVMFRVKGGGITYGTALVVSYIVIMLYSEINIYFFLLLLAAAGLLVVYNTVWKKSGA